METFFLDKTFKFPMLEINCCAIGNFDGVHLAHKNLINHTLDNSFKSLVITFDHLPKEKIIDLDDKLKKIEQLNIDYLIVLKYDDFKDMFYDEFIKMLKKIKVKKVVIGKDFRFGFKQEGDYIDLQNKFEVEIIEDILIDNKKVSSSRIRSFLKDGNVVEANKLLGYNYFMKGNVVSGAQLGRTIGFPTANIIHNDLIKTGVYKTNTTINDITYKSITNIGFNPTFNKQNKLIVETNIIDFNEDIYDKEIIVEFIDKIRDEKKFNSKDELVNQLNNDKNLVISM